jgi:hypothetical protein
MKRCPYCGHEHPLAQICLEILGGNRTSPDVCMCDK